MSFHTISHLNVSKDISKYSKIIIDTNVLLFVHGGYILSQNEHKKANAYANVINDLINNNNEIFVSPISLQELFHVIENKEYKLYLSTHTTLPTTYSKKTFRSDSNLRNKLKLKINSVYQQIESVYKIPNYNEISKENIIEFINTYDTHKFDPMDFALTKNYSCYASVYYVTDDKDFKSNPQLEVISF